MVPGIYQVRGFDLANISFVKAKTGWIVIDPLTAKETARAALKFVNEKLGERPVVAVIISPILTPTISRVSGVSWTTLLRCRKSADHRTERFYAGVYPGKSLRR